MKCLNLSLLPPSGFPGGPCWLNPSGNQKAKNHIGAVLGGQSPGDQSRVGNGRGVIRWEEGTCRE